MHHFVPSFTPLAPFLPIASLYIPPLGRRKNELETYLVEKVVIDQKSQKQVAKIAD